MCSALSRHSLLVLSASIIPFFLSVYFSYLVTSSSSTSCSNFISLLRALTRFPWMSLKDSVTSSVGSTVSSSLTMAFAFSRDFCLAATTGSCRGGGLSLYETKSRWQEVWNIRMFFFQLLTWSTIDSRFMAKAHNPLAWLFL